MVLATPTSSATAPAVGLDKNLSTGLIFLGVIALLSALSTVALMSFISYRASRWHRFYSKDIKKNPFVILLVNLFLADFFQSFGFLFSFHWYGLKDIISATGPCTVQGFFINFGDVSSAFFVLAIAMQTWSHIKFQRQLRFDAFLAIVVCIWIFALILTVLGPVTTTEYFVDTGAWCWVDGRYKSQRLAYHYFWIFLVEFGTIIMYGFVIWELRRSSTRLQAQNEVSFERAADTHRRIRKSCLIMCCYPISYITLTLPLAISRMAEVRGFETSLSYRIFCGSFLVSSGWVDTLLYVLTRGAFLKSHNLHHRESGRSASTITSPTPPPKDAPKRVYARSPSPNLSPIDSLERHPTRMTSMSSWTTNWSETKILPHHRAEEPLSTIDHEILAQASRTLTLDAKV